MENHEITVAHALDKYRECSENYALTSTDFLDISERSAVGIALGKSGARFTFFGGYDGAERTVCVFVPDYIENVCEYFHQNPDDCPIKVLRCKSKPGSPSLSHRDYLGSLMALGIERRTLGDIIVYDGGADIIILNSIEKYLLSEYKSAGRVNFETEALDITKLTPPKVNVVQKRISVASARLDSIVAEAFDLSRDKASGAIEGGTVFVDSVQVTKPDAKVKEGAAVVLRGAGKIRYVQTVGQTKRDRTAIIIEKYV
ncbi:MAG: RNA-binding protein [Clostridiales bacterium]|nr:RNA-binding protein [Clostridiales bacterium]